MKTNLFFAGKWTVVSRLKKKKTMADFVLEAILIFLT